MQNIALIVAGGNGTRVGSNVPKQYLKLNGKYILRLSIERFLAHPKINSVKVVIAQDHDNLYREATEGLKLLPFSYGGILRNNSVLNGLKDLKQNNPKNVLIHDAARPFVSDQIISEVIEKLTKYKAVDVGAMIKDTIKSLNENKISLIDRNKLYATQTPQGFDFNTILALHEKYKDLSPTDDISLAIKDSIDIGLANGSENNFKITTEHDLRLGEFLFKEAI